MDYPYEDANWALIPAHMHDGVRRYVCLGHPVGGFLTSLFDNDFMRAVGEADDQNLAALREWAVFLYNWMPTGSYGSPAKRKAWQAKGGLAGITDERLERRREAGFQ